MQQALQASFGFWRQYAAAGIAGVVADVTEMQQVGWQVEAQWCTQA
jgi:hypothetical protein